MTAYEKLFNSQLDMARVLQRLEARQKVIGCVSNEDDILFRTCKAVYEILHVLNQMEESEGDKQIETIRETLSTEELLCQLAEECAELGHAALKLRRAISKENPTPVTVDEAMDDVIEEIADIRLVVSVLKYDQCEPVYREIMRRKTERWVSRLEDYNV